jgi:hypothetical protein
VVARFLGTDVDDPLELPRLGSIIAGSIGGAMLGSRTPPLPPPAGFIVNPVTGALALGAAGAFLGAVAPETTLELAETFGVVEPGTRERVGLSPEELRTVAEGEVLLDLATGGGLAAVRLLGRGATRVFAGIGRAERELAERAAKQDIHLMPVQVGNRTISRGFVAVMGRFPLIGPRFRQAGQAAEEAAERALRDLPERIGPLVGWSTISERIFRDAHLLLTRVNNIFDARYTALFARADDLGVWALPRETLGKADEILAKLQSEVPAGLTKEIKLGPALSRVQAFIMDTILPMRDVVLAGVAVAKQNLRQMDGLITKIDEEIASLEPGQRRFARSLLLQLRQAAKLDVLTNLYGTNAGEIARGLKELDTEFSHTMSSIFETSTAKRFQSVERRGLRGVAFEKTTRTPVDQLARIVVKLDSPQAIDELTRLVSPETFKRITAKVFDDSVLDAMRTVGSDAHQFDPEKWARALGLDRPGSDRYKVIARMIEKSGSPLTITDLDDLLAATRAIAGMEIPNVSSFIARRATIGGIQAIINGMIPGLAIAGGARVAGNFGGTLVGMAVFLGGGRLVSAILARPESARALKAVLNREATNLVRRKATIQAIRFGLASLKDERVITDDEMIQLTDIFNRMIAAFDRQIESMEEGEVP